MHYVRITLNVVNTYWQRPLLVLVELLSVEIEAEIAYCFVCLLEDSWLGYRFVDC